MLLTRLLSCYCPGCITAKGQCGVCWRVETGQEEGCFQKCLQEVQNKTGPSDAAQISTIEDTRPSTSATDEGEVSNTNNTVNAKNHISTPSSPVSSPTRSSKEADTVTVQRVWYWLRRQWIMGGCRD